MQQPSEDKLMSYAGQALRYARRNHLPSVHVLVYLSDPETLIYNPQVFANTVYKKHQFAAGDGDPIRVDLTIGETD